MKKIMIAYDGSPGAEAALAEMRCAGLPDRCEALVFTVADFWLPPEAIADPTLPESQAISRLEAHQQALDVLAGAAQTSARGAEQLRLLFPGWDIGHGSKADSPAWAILAEARAWEADLIVIGSHGRSPLQKLFLGSVSYKVAAEASCSVRIHRGNTKAQRDALRIFIALDGSSDAEGALQEALNRKWPAQTEFQLVSVVERRLQPTGVPGETQKTVPDRIGEMLARHRDAFERRGLKVTTHLIEGESKSALLHHAQHWNADCIFAGARGMQHGSRLYLGTVASAIISRAHCTVEVVRPGRAGASSEFASENLGG